MRMKQPPCHSRQRLTLFASGASAQDACATLSSQKSLRRARPSSAQLNVVADTTLADADERRVDTKRIQDAIDHCSSGKAVVLKPDGAKRGFLSGPLELKRGVTLIVDTNATLGSARSRDPRLYDVDAGRCGTVDERGHACKPLISGEKADGSGVMGPGTIDGRGWAKLIGRDSSWWDLAQLAKVKNQSQSCPSAWWCSLARTT